jgi:hypothetical protein
MGIIKAIYFLVRAFFVCRSSLAAENLALRQQVAVYKHSVKRPKLRPRDRVFWVWLSRLWSNWRSALAIVQPETVIQWHRQGFKLYWRWRSRARKSASLTSMAIENCGSVEYFDHTAYKYVWASMPLSSLLDGRYRMAG